MYRHCASGEVEHGPNMVSHVSQKRGLLACGNTGSFCSTGKATMKNKWTIQWNNVSLNRIFIEKIRDSSNVEQQLA